MSAIDAFGSLGGGAAQAPVKSTGGGGTKAKIDWKVNGAESFINNVRNVALSFLFVDIAQERAMRSAGTLGMAMLSLEETYIKAHFAALLWGQSNLAAVQSTQAFAIASQNVEQLTKQYGQLTSAWIEATQGGRFINPRALQLQSKMDVLLALHPGLDTQQQMVEQVRIMNVQLMQARLHLAVSQLMLRENVRIAQIAERLLEVQIVQSSVMVGAALGGGSGPGAMVGAAGGLVAGLAFAKGAADTFQTQTDTMLSMADNLNSLANKTYDMATSTDDATQAFKDMNEQIVKTTDILRTYNTSQGGSSNPWNIMGGQPSNTGYFGQPTLGNQQANTVQ